MFMEIHRGKEDAQIYTIIKLYDILVQRQFIHFGQSLQLFGVHFQINQNKLMIMLLHKLCTLLLCKVCMDVRQFKDVSIGYT